MASKANYPLVGIILATTFWSPGSVCADGDKETAHSFKLTVATKMNTKLPDTTQKVEADTELCYTWTVLARKRVLSFDSLLSKACVDGKQTTNAFINREKIVTVQDGMTTEVPFAKAAPMVKKMLEDSFGAPVWKLQVDEHGKELKRELVGGPGTAELVRNNTIANALLFHPPFRRDQDEWQADLQVPTAGGQLAKGTLSYRKTVGSKETQTVKVSGTLTNADAKLEGKIRMNAKYFVDGEQTFSFVDQQWLKGKLTMDLSWQFLEDGHPVGSSTGVMVVSFEKLAK